jgi:hypothetical protein
MAIFNRCCCCSLKTGCMVLGILMVVGGLYGVGSSIKYLATYTGLPSEDVMQKEVEMFRRAGVDIDKDDIILFDGVTFYSNIVGLIHNSISVPIYTLLMVGVQNVTYKLIVPSMAWLPVSFVISIVHMAVVMALFGMDHMLMIVTMVVIFGIVAALDLLLWLCLYSHWQQVKLQVGAPEKMQKIQNENYCSPFKKVDFRC